MSNLDSPQSHWDAVSQSYGANWTQGALDQIDAREVALFSHAVAATCPARVLDVGVGAGRIIDMYLKQPSVGQIYGIDLADQMVQRCRERFASSPLVQDIQQCDIASDAVPFQCTFQFISAIRVLKYIEAWPEVLAKLTERLEPDGGLVFSVANRFSTIASSRSTTAIYLTTRGQARSVCKSLGLQIATVACSSRLPDRAYLSVRSRWGRTGLLTLEHMIDKVLPGAVFGREVFIIAHKPS